MTLDARSALTVAAALLRGHTDPTVQEIGDWLASGGSGDLAVWLGEDRRAWLGERYAQRDRLLREGAPRYWPALSTAARAELLSRLLGRYRAGAWSRDRVKPDCPYRIGDPRSLFWAALRLIPRDVSAERLRKILVINNG